MLIDGPETPTIRGFAERAGGALANASKKATTGTNIQVGFFTGSPVCFERLLGAKAKDF
jgi:hypothetical protein